MLVRGPWALSSSVTATKHRLGYVIIILYHWWYFNWGGPGPLALPGYAYCQVLRHILVTPALVIALRS